MDLPTHSSKTHDAPPVFRAPFRRRRMLWGTLLLTALLLFLAPSSFWEQSQRLTSDAAAALRPARGSTAAAGAYSELAALLHMVAGSELQLPRDADPTQPLPADAYGAGDDGAAWLRAADADPPVIVFSKTYCPYSAAAKELLATYAVTPPPKIVEVDLRDDAEMLKSVLTRLTGHATFPNVFVGGVSLGGSDDLQRLHTQGALAALFTGAGATVLGA